mgnify:CR=1 FL=1
MNFDHRKSISVKLLRYVLLTAFSVGVFVSFIQIVLDAYASREGIKHNAEEILNMVRDPATQAVYSLDEEMAEQVVNGLFGDSSIRFAGIGHPKEPMLAENQRPLSISQHRWLTDWIFSPQQTFKVGLFGGEPFNEYYGDIVITVDTFSEGSRFLRRSIVVFLSGILRAMTLAIVLYLVYYFFLTRPLSILINSLIQINPDQPTEQKIPTVPGHDQDEIGVWVKTANELLGSIERNHSKRRKAEAHVLRLAQYDYLTGLPNRLMLQKQLQRMIQDTHKEKKLIAILVCGIDDFKGINEQFTYKTGDHLLVTLADRLRHNRESIRAIARLGGDLFALVQEEISHPYEAAKLAQSILDDLDQPFIIADKHIKVSATVGISLFPDDALDAEKLLQKAEHTMTLAKTQNRNRFQFYVASVDSAIRERKQIEKDLSNAISNNEFFLVYQPQISLQTKRIEGAEALIRWQHPVKGLIPPDQFIPLAENNPVIIDIGQWVLETACHQLKDWHSKGFKDLTIAVNLSTKQLRLDSIDSAIQQVIDETGIPPHSLELEITETAVMDSISTAISRLNSIKKTGVKLALDDFGTGYSSLSYLKRLPLDKIKIDREFIRDVLEDKYNTAIVKSIIQLGRNLDMDVIAEGVETIQQEKYLIENHCAKAQGYYYSKPITAAQFLSLVQHSTTIST